MIELKDLSYTYSRHGVKALDSVTGIIAPGVHLLMGENGAGKSTLLRVMAGLARPVGGDCLLDGESTLDLRPAMRRRLFFIPDDLMLPTRTILEYASVTAPLYPSFDEDMLRANLADFGLTGNERMQSLSLGQKHKTLLAYAISLRPELLLLDEPANGLDISSRKVMRSMMARCVGEEQTVIISTHTPADLHALYDGVMMLSHGNLLLCHPTWHIASRVTFRADPVPPADAIFSEPDSGRFLSIVPGGGEGDDVDFGLLYSALLSPARHAMIELINTPDDEIG